MTRANTRPAGRTIPSQRRSPQPPPVTGLYELGRALGRGQPAPEEVSRRQADREQAMVDAFETGRKYERAVGQREVDRDYWAGYADAVSDLYGAADGPLDVPDAPEQTGTSTHNVTDLAAYRCGGRAVRPRGGHVRRAKGER